MPLRLLASEVASLLSTPELIDLMERALAELEKIVARMESGELSLEEALATHKRGLELARLCQKQLEAADSQMIQEDEQPCCYARSDKYWITDPTGIVWETFHSLASIPVYGADTPVFNHGTSVVPVKVANPDSGCCVPAAKASKQTPASACCASNEPTA